MDVSPPLLPRSIPWSNGEVMKAEETDRDCRLPAWLCVAGVLLRACGELAQRAGRVHLLYAAPSGAEQPELHSLTFGCVD